ncbi:MAG: hypothetical protein ACHQ7M_21645, partial [Chloroflexota bacterium]
GLVAGRLTRGLKDADAGSDGRGTISAQTAPESSVQSPARLPDLAAGRPRAADVNERHGLSDPAAGDLAPGGSEAPWEASSARDEPSSLLTNGQPGQRDAS